MTEKPTLIVGEKKKTAVSSGSLKPGYRQLPDPIRGNKLHWLAGLLEGEGWFDISGRKTPWPHPRIQLQMTDRDTVERAAKLFGGNKVWRLKGATPERKDTYRVEVSGRQAAALMRQLRPLMGSRRAARIDEVLANWEARDNRRST